MAQNEDEFDQEVTALEEEEKVVPEVEPEPEPEVVAKEQYDNIHKAMDKERHEKREIQQKFEQYKSEMDEKYARADERLNTLNKMWGGEDEVDPEVQRQAEFAEQKKRLDEIAQQQNLINLQNTLNSQESQFAAVTPDYAQAKKHYFTTRMNSLGKLGYTQEQAQQQIAMETMQFSQTALSQNENAAQRLYEAAKEVGYTPITSKGEEKLKTIEEGQNQKSMPKGGAPKGELTMETLSNMSDEEFASLTEEQIRSVMGG
jgi:hypothetical protein